MKWEVVMTFDVEANQVSPEDIGELEFILHNLDMAYETLMEILGNFNDRDIGEVKVRQKFMVIKREE